MKNLLPVLLVGILPYLFTSCQAKTKEAEEPNIEVEEMATAMEVSFVCRSLSDDETMPSHQVSLILNGKSHLLDTIAACNDFIESTYPDYDIPAEAVAAAGGWFAGGGDYYYALVEDNVCTVMYGWQDEMQEDEGFHYEQVRRFVVSK